jgi:hypothetical protein
VTECTGTPTNRSTRFDWTRYFWAMRTVQGVTLTNLWAIWDAADPHNWDPDDGSGATMPLDRWTNAVTNTGVGFLTEHQNEDEHGLDH